MHNTLFKRSTLYMILLRSHCRARAVDQDLVAVVEGPPVLVTPCARSLSDVSLPRAAGSSQRDVKLAKLIASSARVPPGFDVATSSDHRRATATSQQPRTSRRSAPSLPPLSAGQLTDANTVSLPAPIHGFFTPLQPSRRLDDSDSSGMLLACLLRPADVCLHTRKAGFGAFY